MLIGTRFECEYTVGEAIGQAAIWVALVSVTLGLALFVLPYGKLHVDVGF